MDVDYWDHIQHHLYDIAMAHDNEITRILIEVPVTLMEDVPVGYIHYTFSQQLIYVLHQLDVRPPSRTDESPRCYHV